MPIWSNLNQAFGGSHGKGEGLDLPSLPEPRNNCEVCGRKVSQSDIREQEMPTVGYRMICVDCHHALYPRPGEKRSLWALPDFAPASASIERAVLSLFGYKTDSEIDAP